MVPWLPWRVVAARRPLREEQALQIPDHIHPIDAAVTAGRAPLEGFPPADQEGGEAGHRLVRAEELPDALDRYFNAHDGRALGQATLAISSTARVVAATLANPTSAPRRPHRVRSDADQQSDDGETESAE
jgi:hypothetical protein